MAPRIASSGRQRLIGPGAEWDRDLAERNSEPQSQTVAGEVGEPRDHSADH